MISNYIPSNAKKRGFCRPSPGKQEKNQSTLLQAGWTDQSTPLQAGWIGQSTLLEAGWIGFIMPIPSLLYREILKSWIKKNKKPPWPCPLLIKENDKLPIRTRDGLAFPRVILRAAPSG